MHPADEIASGPGAPRAQRVATADGPVTVAGRPRNAQIDRTVLAVALRHLRASGLQGLSVAAVAEEAGTTRAAVYRRWAGRTELAIAAIGTIGHDVPPEPTGDPFADLVAELARFRDFVVESDATALAATALLDGTDPRVREQFRRHVVEPRHRRFRACLRAGVEAGALRGRTDYAMAEDLLTGSWLAHAVRGEPMTGDWARRTAAMVWAACGGVPREP
ncbi:TetR/AcrR family transcriptional regulator [Actinomycetospora cinnamomea]|uniref:TetR/AcrR family transcriptional regulator n=1 Tax=Actinomycetospora cinnamomea TaxID=663609 RepID=UPI0014028239|nr:TetR/AcrR family transcriptional regulator [Actinomycetospora cinnamomea]